MDGPSEFSSLALAVAFPLVGTSLRTAMVSCVDGCSTPFSTPFIAQIVVTLGGSRVRRWIKLLLGLVGAIGACGLVTTFVGVLVTLSTVVNVCSASSISSLYDVPGISHLNREEDSGLEKLNQERVFVEDLACRGFGLLGDLAKLCLDGNL